MNIVRKWMEFQRRHENMVPEFTYLQGKGQQIKEMADRRPLNDAEKETLKSECIPFYLRMEAHARMVFQENAYLVALLEEMCGMLRPVVELHNAVELKTFLEEVDEITSDQLLALAAKQMKLKMAAIETNNAVGVGDESGN